MNVAIRPAEGRDIPGLVTVLDGVAREKKYLAMTEGPPPDASAAFFRGAIEQGEVMRVAVRQDDAGETVLG